MTELAVEPTLSHEPPPRCPVRAPKDPLPAGLSVEAARSHPRYKYFLEPQAQCELDAGHGAGTAGNDVSRRHANGCLLWWDPPIIVVGS